MIYKNGFIETKDEKEDREILEYHERLEEEQDRILSQDQELISAFADFINKLSKGDADSESIDQIWSIIEFARNVPFKDRHLPVVELVKKAVRMAAIENLKH